MKISTILLTLIISCSLSYGQYYGKDFKDMSQSEKIMMYNSYNKSPALGVFFEFLIPTVGHAYAGNWTRGLLFKGGQIGLWSLVAFKIYAKNDPVDILPHEEAITIAIGGTIAIQIWEYVDVVKSVKKYNHNLYREIFGKEPPSFSLNLLPTYQGANLTLAYKFD